MSKLYVITFTDNSTIEEYGYSVEDIRDFCNLVYTDKTVLTIKLHK